MSNPRSLFYQQTDLAKWHRELVDDNKFETTITYALAQFGSFCPSQEQLVGVSRFLDVLRNLSVREEVGPKEFGGPRLVPPELLVSQRQPKHD